MEGLLLGFVIGHFVLLIGMVTLTLRTFPLRATHSSPLISCAPARCITSLIWAGFLYNLAVWADKLMFWFYPDTSQSIIGPLRASLIYDLPIFLAYLAIIPGMAVFLVRIETDFVEYYEKFYDAVREGGSLDHIETMRDNMLFTVRQGLFEIVKIQAIAVLLVFVLGEKLLDWLGISQPVSAAALRGCGRGRPAGGAARHPEYLLLPRQAPHRGIPLRPVPVRQHRADGAEPVSRRAAITATASRCRC